MNTNYFPVAQTQQEFSAMCVKMANSQMVPATFRGKPDEIFVAAMWGNQLGLSPIVAVQNIAVINGKPSIYGDLAKAICYKSGLMTSCVETVEGDGMNAVAICKVTRKGEAEPHIFRFGMEDAKQARLLDKAGPWSQYPKRMLQMRARGFALRDVFPDVLAGLITAEEAEDYNTQEEQKAAPAPQPRPEPVADDVPPEYVDAEIIDAEPIPALTDERRAEIEQQIGTFQTVRDLFGYFGTLSEAEQDVLKPLFTQQKEFIRSVQKQEQQEAAA